jgi:hypothetical protein
LRSQSIEQRLSGSDRQRIEKHHLGSLLAVSRSVHFPLLILYSMSYALLLLGIVVAALVFVNILFGWLAFLPSKYVLLTMYMSMSGVCFLTALYILRIEKPKVPPQKYLVVCEQGLIQETQERRHKHIEIVHWSDILAIKNPSSLETQERSYHVRWSTLLTRKKPSPEEMAYTFVLRNREPFLLDHSYQRVERIVELIKEQVESVSHHNRDGDRRMEQ